MDSGETGFGGLSAVAAATCLLAACLTGGPLYVSAAASESVQTELATTCLADAGLQIPVRSDRPDALVDLDRAAAALANVSAPYTTRGTRAFPVSVDGAPEGEAVRFAVLINRTGQVEQFDPPIAGLGLDETAVPEWFRAPEGVQPGDGVTLVLPEELNTRPRIPAGQLPLTVTAIYPTVPVRPEPAYWCGLRAFFRPNVFGDLPHPVFLVSSETLDQLDPRRVGWNWELRPDPDGLTRHEAEVLADQFDSLVAVYAKALGHTVEELTLQNGRPATITPGLRAVIRHAEVVADVVGGTMGPVRLAGVAAALALLVAAAVLVVRERSRELRLRLLRGVAPGALGTRVAAGVAPAALLGTVAGSALAFVGVRLFGPTPELEPGPVRVAVTSTLVGLVIAVVLVGVVAGMRSALLVDARTRRSHRRTRRVPWEVALVALTVASFLRLDKVGGIRQVGATAQGGDLLAQAFPLLGVAAPLVVLARPAAAVMRRGRLWGARLRPSLLLGLRRAIAEPGVTLSLMGATALAAGSFCVASLLTDSSQQLLRDKAGTYLGSDLIFGTRQLVELPPAFRDKGTMVTRVKARGDGQSIEVLGIDPDTFANAVRWRDDGADRSLAALVATIADPPAGTLPAIVAGGTLADGNLRTLNNRRFEIQTAGEADWFPGYHNGALLVVVDRDALDAVVADTAIEVWLRDPPDDATAQLTAAGLVPGSPLELEDVFDVTSFLSVRWSYGSLTAFAALIGIVVLIAQLLVLDARRRSRQAVHVLTSRMGMGTRAEAAGLLAELAPPMLLGAGLGLGIGWIVARLAVVRLDTLRQLQPPARLVVENTVVVAVLGAALLALVILVAIGVVAIRRTRTMEVMRGAV